MNWLSDRRWAALGFAVSVAYWPGLQGSFVPRWAVIAVGIPLVSQVDPRRLPLPVLGVLGFVLLIGAMSVTHSPWPLAGVGDLIFMLILSVAFIAGAGLASLDDVMAGAGLGLGLSATIVVIQVLGWSPVVEAKGPSGLFYNSEVLGEFSGLVAAWFVAKFIGEKSVRFASLALIALVPTLLSHSRIGLAVVVLAAIMAWRPRGFALFSVIVLALVGAGGAILFTKLDSSAYRAVIWGTTLLSTSFRGNGLGWGSAAFPFEEFSHSDALQALAELGAAALVLLYIPIAAYRGKRGHHAEHALFAAILVEIAVSFPLHFPATGFLVAIVAGYLVADGSLLWNSAPVGYRRNEWRDLRRPDVAGNDDRASQPIGGMVSVRSLSAELAQLRHPAAQTGGV